MQSSYGARFEREMGCTPDELRAWLPGASAGAPVSFEGDGAQVALPGGRLVLRWRQLPARRIALLALPRLAVSFAFDDAVDATVRHRYMKHFDLYTQRGGG